MFKDKDSSHNRQNGSTIRDRISWLQLAALGLVIMIHYAMGLGLSGAVRGLETDLIWVLMAAGMVFGWGLVNLAKHIWSAVLLSFTSGVFFSSLVVGRMWDELWSFSRGIAFWLESMWDSMRIAYYSEFVPPSIGPILIDLYNLTDGFYIMLQRLVIWVIRFPRMTSDMTANLTAWGVFIWLAVIWAVWNLWRRGRPLEAVIPGLFSVALTRIDADASSSVILVMMGMSIALMILSAQVAREKYWHKEGIGYSDLIRKNASRSALVLSVVLVVAASGFTSIDLERIQERWDEFTSSRNQSDDLVKPAAGENGSNGSVEVDEERLAVEEQFSWMGLGGLPTDHLVGAGPELSEEVVMTIRVEEFDAISGKRQDVDMSEQTYYFRSLTYDRYTSQGWLAAIGRVFVYQPGEEAITKYNSYQRLIRQEVRYDQYIDEVAKIYSVGDLVVVDREYSVAWREREGLREFVDMFGGTVSSQSYEVYSVAPAYSEDGLRNSFPDYPDWIEERYLALPETVPDRVIDLAYQLTNDQFSAYDKVVAIEQYLRTFPYTLDLPPKPEDLDIADYFLFESKTGYCDYYASTMVVLARAVGIPARLAVGYIGGTYDEENNYLLVTADQAHSWVEVYFPEYGWVTFEPTAGRSAVDREQMVPLTTEYFERDIPFKEREGQFSGLEITLGVLFGVLISSIVGFLIWLRVDIWMLKRQSIGNGFARMYRQLLGFGGLLKIEHGIAQTPLEFADEMRDKLEIMRLKHGRFKFLEKTPPRVVDLVVLANKAAYHSEPPDVIERDLAVDHWVTIRRHLSMLLIWDWLTGSVTKIK